MRPGDQIRGVRRDPAGRDVAARHGPRPRDRDGAIGLLVVTGGEAPGHDLVREEERVLQAERLEQQLSHRPLVGLAGYLLDDPSGDRQRSVVVGHDRAERRDLFDVGHTLHVPRQRVVAVAGVVHQVALPSGGVVEELQHGHRARGLFVLESQLGKVGADRRVEIDQPPVDEPQQRRRRVRLPGRAELEQRVLLDRQGVLVTPWNAYCSSPLW